MKLLLDECVPRKLMFDLSHHGHEVMTVNDAGFSGKENGELLKLADSRFDALLTVDKNLPKQQNLSGRRNFNHHHSLKLQSACRESESIYRHCFLLLPI